MELLRTCRSVLRELKAVSGGGEAGEQWRFILSAIRDRGTDAREREKAKSTLDSYLAYLESSRQHRELLERYQGRGERSIEETASLAGLALPGNGMGTEGNSSQHGTGHSRPLHNNV